jgi:hypothetical protein
MFCGLGLKERELAAYLPTWINGLIPWTSFVPLFESCWGSKLGSSGPIILSI